MVAFGENVGQPHGGEPAIGETPMQAVIAEMPIQYFREAPTLHQPDQQRHVVDALVG